MTKQDDNLSAATDELNQRLSRAQRSLVRVNVMASVAGGVACVTWLLSTLEGDAVPVLVAAFLATALATMGIGAQLSRLVLYSLKRSSITELSRAHGVQAADLESFALPFGGPPDRPGSQARWLRALAGAVAILLLAAAVGLFAGWEVAGRVLATVVSVLTTAAFWSYLGFRAPR